MMSLDLSYLTALDDFQRAQRRASLRKIFRRFRKHNSLLSYETTRQQLRAIEKSGDNLQIIPINAIQGSVGRYTDFTRDFLPTGSVDPQRWARVKAQFHSLEGVPPIDVYKIGEVYFVSDGNHRVSVAREMGNSTIEAHVREVVAKVPLEVDESIDQLLIKAEYTEFLEQTRFDHLYPEVNLMVTAPGCYTIMAQQIEAIHFSRELKVNKPVPYSEAVRYWYDTIYDPIIESVREQDIISTYPERTETDLFLWIFKHQVMLGKTLGWEVSPKSSARNLMRPTTSSVQQFIKQSKQLLKKVIHPRTVDTGPPPGTWRQEKMATPEGRLFASIIVVIDGSVTGWEAFSQGVFIAGLEGSQLYGLHITNPKRPITKNEQQTIQAEFNQRCESCKTEGQLAFESGSLDQIIRERAYWADLVVISAQDMLPSTLITLAQTCPVPLLISKSTDPELKSILLVYDGSPKSEEALFLAAYLATFWELSLKVITILEKEHVHVNPESIVHAKDFLDHYGVSAHYQQTEHEPIMKILKTTQDFDIDLILLGGLSVQTKTNTKNSVLGEVFDKTQQTIMICR